MKVIVNADDFGYDATSVQSTIECFESGGLSSATIMANMPGFEAAVDYALKHPQFSFGVHLNWCEGSPLTKPLSLLDGQGQFLHSQVIRKRALVGKLSVQQIADEARAQIKRVRDAGVPISHIDSHGHIHKFAPFMRAMRVVLPEFGIRRMRTSQDIYLRPAWKSPTYWVGPVWRRRIRKAYVTTSHLAMPDGHDPQGWIDAMLGHCTGSSLEVGVHPGIQHDWQRVQTSATHELGSALRSAEQHQIITWNDLAA